MIKCNIIAAVTADGFIAKDEHHPAMWTSKADKKRFVEVTKKAGVIVMGSHTWKTIGRPLKERVNIVYSRKQDFSKEGAEMTNDDPITLLSKLEARGFKEVAICGGTNIYTMFMKAKVVDRIYLTVEPIVFGKGLSLFNEDLLFNLELISSVQSESSGSLLLEYKVNYSGTQKMKD
jgi:dihydrofolate reductase